MAEEVQLRTPDGECIGVECAAFVGTVSYPQWLRERCIGGSGYRQASKISQRQLAKCCTWGVNLIMQARGQQFLYRARW